MITETRNEWGFPIVPAEKFQSAKAYAAGAKERNKPVCTCLTCRQIEMLPSVQRLTQNWRSK
ncbi:hypothetical protein SAMN06265795_12625 [Noviherbaspirillum humi]|uniref:Uncharacterized protein n=1 Tax=Noviherbaspirillum humi TaxID=1688639 RepID=A0A239LSX9_9BURK|nr:hypothetical protein [Noviherbaspirillum humi]SNT33475.1 hypothetical protein SAMN06265795_12625 [Noviherbaspirillum humi]